jgi:hypothetical protein
MVTIVSAQTKANYTIIADLANCIWTEHYTPIIGEQQVAYMLKKFQSVFAIEAQVEKGMLYYLLLHQDNPVGYFYFKNSK